ncbi:MAG: dipeptide epimerase [Bacteroidales bacterium]|nr:dipeptide epimerase [Bacteroidales bacterium]
MKNSRRKFLRYFGLMTGGTLLSFDYASLHAAAGKSQARSSKNKMVLQFEPYILQLRHVFTIASGSRTTTPVMLTTITFDGITGYGEASMPPYLGESHATAQSFLAKVDLSRFSSPFLMDDILTYVDQIAPGNYAAKASIDIALHDLVGKLMQQPWHRIWGLNPGHTPDTSFTIGIDKPDMVEEKTRAASSFKILKIKLGGGNDKEMIRTVRSVTQVPLGVDVNQGWKDRNQALDMIHWLHEQGVVYIEQPLSKTAVDDIAWITGQSPVPVIADEALQTPADVNKVFGAYHGINIKLMKCGGLRAAYTMVNMARTLGLKVMIGCMTETSCAVTAAAQLSPMADWADLDGNLLISNDVFEGLKIVEGRVIIPDLPGIGVLKL